MTEYLIYFNQQWVGDHTTEWFQSRVATSMAVVHEMEAAGVLVYAGGLEEDGPVVSADATSGSVLQQLTRQAIEQALQQTGGSVTQAARLLGIGRATLYRRLRRADSGNVPGVRS